MNSISYDNATGYRRFTFTNVEELDSFVEYFGELVEEWDRIRLHAYADITDADYDSWCQTLEELAMCRNPNHPAKGSTIVIEPLRSLDDVAKVCAVLKDQPRNLALFALGVSSNLRASDLLKLRANDIDWQKCEIILREKKTSKRRHIAIPPNVMSYLSAIRGADDAYLFGNSRTGEQMTVEALNALVKKWTFRAGIPGHFGSHTLRKTWAFCQYRIFKMDLADVSEQLNHSNMNTTYRYLGIMPAKIRAMYMNEICPAI